MFQLLMIKTGVAHLMPQVMQLPTLKNSQAIDGSKEETIISINPTVFSPDNDGFDDHTLIEINSNIGGAWSSILILDLSGNKIKQLLNADLIGSDDKLIWDGTDERNRILPSGIYILYAEIITEQGQVQKMEGGKPRYTIFSLWDTFRALNPLFTITQPKLVPDLYQ